MKLSRNKEARTGNAGTNNGTARGFSGSVGVLAFASRAHTANN